MSSAAPGPGGDALRKLEYLSLVSKVCTELETHIGVGNKVLAEFITELGRDSASVPVFDAKLKANGVDFPDYFVRTLLTIIHAILPPPAHNPSSAAGQSGAENTKLRALSRPDDPEHARHLRLELERDASAVPVAPPARVKTGHDSRGDNRSQHADHERKSDDWRQDQDRDRGRTRGDHSQDCDRRSKYFSHDRGRNRDDDRRHDRDRDRGRAYGHSRDQERYRDSDSQWDHNRGRGRDMDKQWRNISGGQLCL